jgi:hypothetical protein
MSLRRTPPSINLDLPVYRATTSGSARIVGETESSCGLRG